jgi:23S rRNA (guanosine2251-2'-O)-methyltransferase
MAGNSQRRGATRNPGSKKGAKVGSGGQGRQALEGRGPTPKATERPYHPAAKRKAAFEGPVRSTSDGPARSRGVAGRPSRSAGGSKNGKGSSSTHEIVTGRNSVVEALRAGIPVTTVYMASRLEPDDRTREILAAVTERGYPLLQMTKPELDRMTDGAVHQGVAIQVPPYEYADADDLLDAAAASATAPLVVALDGVTDPRNLGAVLRSAGAFGAHGVIVPERRAAGITAAAWKVSAGAAARVPVARVTNLVRTLDAYRSAGCYIVGLDGAGDVPIGELPYATDPLVLVVGSEGKGLSRLVREHCDAIASIPIASTMESLNAGVAAGIALYEVTRQRTV